MVLIRSIVVKFTTVGASILPCFVPRHALLDFTHCSSDFAVNTDPDRTDARRRFAEMALAAHEMTIEPASADASFRSYWRVALADGSTRIVMDAPPDKENIAPWLDIGARLHRAGLHVPEVFAVDRAQGFILMEDLGSDAYLPALTDATADALYADALDALLRMQTSVDPVGLPVFDEAFVTMELEIMPEWFLRRHLGHEIACEEWDVIELAFMRLIEAVRKQPQTFMHRDYHSRNLMVCDASTTASLPSFAAIISSSLPPRAGEGGAAAPEGGAFPPRDKANGSAASLRSPLSPSAPSPVNGGRNHHPVPRLSNPGIIDFQGAVIGPITYDLASLLRDCYIEWDAERVEGWLESHRQRLVAAHLLDAHTDAATFRRWFDLTGLQRHIKVLGLFCRLCYRDGKPHYLADLPLVWRYVMSVARRYNDLAPLADLLERALGERDITQPREVAA